MRSLTCKLRFAASLASIAAACDPVVDASYRGDTELVLQVELYHQNPEVLSHLKYQGELLHFSVIWPMDYVPPMGHFAMEGRHLPVPGVLPARVPYPVREGIDRVFCPECARPKPNVKVGYLQVTYWNPLNGGTLETYAHNAVLLAVAKDLAPGSPEAEQLGGPLQAGYHLMQLTGQGLWSNPSSDLRLIVQLDYDYPNGSLPFVPDPHLSW